VEDSSDGTEPCAETVVAPTRMVPPLLSNPAIASFTYAAFLVLFVVPPLVGLGLATWGRAASRERFHPRGVALIVVIALVYTAPWDNYLIARGVWAYGDGTVTAFLVRAPLEEYLFIVLQPIAAALWLGLLRDDDRSMSLSVPLGTRFVGVLAGGLVALLGLGALLGSRTFYLGAILLWAAPVLAIQWGYGWPYLWRYRRLVAMGVVVPTVYFSVADRIAIGNGIWTIAEQYTTGLAVLGLPIEEGGFFLVTNLFVIQGLVLYGWVREQWE